MVDFPLRYVKVPEGILLIGDYEKQNQNGFWVPFWENLGPAELGSNGDIIPETLVGWSGSVIFEVQWRRSYHSGVRPLSQNWSGFFPQQRKLMGSAAQNSSGVHWCRPRVRFNRVPEKVSKKVWEALVQSQVRFNRVSEKVPEKIPGSLGAKPSQVQQGSGEGSGEGRGRFGAARSGSTGFRRRFQRLASQHASERFVNIKRCGCWGYQRSLLALLYQDFG